MPAEAKLSYSDLLERNADLAKAMTGPPYDVRILSNIIVTQAHEILEYTMRSRGIPGVVQSGDYDNIVQDSAKYADCRMVIVFMELCNVIEGLQFELDLLDEAGAEAVFQKAAGEIEMIFAHLKRTPLVLFNRFTAIHFEATAVSAGPLGALAARLNEFAESRKPANVQMVDIEKVIASVGLTACVDTRYFYSSRALYTIAFLKQYAQFTLPYVLAANGKLKKALIFDCDGTLWKGILGEDGESGIDMAADSRTGAIFAEVQSIALSWRKRGVLLGLCSKNNPADVDRVLATHPHMRIRDEHVVIKRVNWQDKVGNLRAIAAELQIGLDSVVFVDDSPFEAELVRSQLPDVEVLLVPSNLSEYPGMLRARAGWFLAGPRSNEDLAKTEMYKAQTARATARESFASIDDYLASLGIRVTVAVDDLAAVPRLAQLSQKTNQFNLTTIRYTEAEVRDFMERDDAVVISISVADRFGDSGVVGLCVLKLDPARAAGTIETFLMSCRVIGRNIEHAIMDFVIEDLKRRGVRTVHARYRETPKNEQVSRFYDSCSFELSGPEGPERNYVLSTDRYAMKKPAYLELRAR